MSLSTSGLLAVWMNVDPAQEADFDAWYTREHIPERVGIPGFRNGCRYAALEGAPRFMALYDTTGADVLSSPAYRERLDRPTSWTKRIMPTFRDTVRIVGRLLGERGQGMGAYARSLRLEPAPGRSLDLREALGGALLDELVARPGVTRVRAAERADAPAPSAESGLRGTDQSASFVLVADGTDAEALRTACDSLLSSTRLAALGVAPGAHAGLYRLLYGLSR